jgi:hypothetical protein
VADVETLTPDDLAWIRANAPRAETDEMWRKLLRAFDALVEQTWALGTRGDEAEERVHDLTEALAAAERDNADYEQRWLKAERDCGAVQARCRVLQANWDACHGQHRVAEDRVLELETVLGYVQGKGFGACTAADKAVLDALDKTSLADLQFLPGLDGILDGVYEAVLRRRQANGTGDSQVDRELAFLEAKHD